MKISDLITAREKARNEFEKLDSELFFKMKNKAAKLDRLLAAAREALFATDFHEKAIAKQRLEIAIAEASKP
jgi:hypothetical protein